MQHGWDGQQPEKRCFWEMGTRSSVHNGHSMVSTRQSHPKHHILPTHSSAAYIPRGWRMPRVKAMGTLMSRWRLKWTRRLSKAHGRSQHGMGMGGQQTAMSLNKARQTPAYGSCSGMAGHTRDCLWLRWRCGSGDRNMDENDKTVCFGLDRHLFLLFGSVFGSCTSGICKKIPYWND